MENTKMRHYSVKRGRVFLYFTAQSRLKKFLVMINDKNLTFIHPMQCPLL